MLLDDVRHRREIFIHQRNDLARRPALRKLGKSGHVREKRRDGAGFSAERGRPIGSQHLFNHCRCQVERKALAQKPLVPIRDDEAVTDSRRQREQTRDRRLDQRQRHTPIERHRGCGGPGERSHNISTDRGHRRKHQHRQRDERGKCDRNRRGASAADFGHRIAAHQVVDRGRVNIHAGDCAADKRHVLARLRKRASRTSHALRCCCETNRRGLAIFHIEERSDEHDLVLEFPTEEVLIALRNTSAEVGKRKCRNIAAATGEIERHRVGHHALNATAGERHASVGSKVRGRAQCARGELHRHRRRAHAIDRK